MAEVLGAVSASAHLADATFNLVAYIKRLCEQYDGLEEYTHNISVDTESIQTGAEEVRRELDATPLNRWNSEDRKLDDDLRRLLKENTKNIKELHQHLKVIDECSKSKLKKFVKRLQSDTKIKSLREELREAQRRIDSHITRKNGRELGRLRQEFYEHDNSSTESVNQLSQEVQTLAEGHDGLLNRVLASQEKILEGQERLYKENAAMKKQIQGVSEQQSGIMSGLQAIATWWWSGSNNGQAPALQPAAAKQIEPPPKPRALDPPRRTAAPGLRRQVPWGSRRISAEARLAVDSTPGAGDVGSESSSVSRSPDAPRRQPQWLASQPPRDDNNNNNNHDSGRCNGPLWDPIEGRRDCTRCGFITSTYARNHAGSHAFVPSSRRG